MIDRLFSFFLIILGLMYGMETMNFQVPFSYDPLGPRPVPLALSSVLIVLATLLLIRPQRVRIPDSPTWTRLAWFSGILLFYQMTWSLLGFLLSTTLSLFMASRLFHCSWMQGLITALILAVVCYGLFNFLLDVPLPLGHIYSYARG